VKIRKKTAEEVVKEASIKMSDPNYSAVMVGGFVQTQSAASQYISAHQEDVGGPDNVIHVVFHAAVIALMFQRANNRTVRELSFDDLNHVSSGDKRAALEEQQPAVLTYIDENIDMDAMKEILILLALAMEWAS
jgi:hypothetical protein